MGKIKNDFQYWMGNNHANVLRGGSRMNISLSDMATMVEEYIQATANRLKAMEDRDRSNVLPETDDEDKREALIAALTKSKPKDVFGESPLYDPNLDTPVDYYEKINRIKRNYGV